MESISLKANISRRKRRFPSSSDKSGKFSTKKVKREKSHFASTTVRRSLRQQNKVVRDRCLQSRSARSLKGNPKKGISYFKRMPVDERYRFIVDGKLLKKEKGAARFEAREPGCIKGGARVYEKIVCVLQVCKDPRVFLTKQYLKELHKVLFEDITMDKRKKGRLKRLQSAGKFRKKMIYFKVCTNYTRRGLLEAQSFYKTISPESEKIFQVDTYTSSSPVSRKIVRKDYPDADKLDGYIKNPKCTVNFRPVNHKLVEAAIDEILSDAQEKIECINNKEDLIKFISCVSYKIHQIHPRIVRALMDSLLMFYGFCPAIWYDPTIIDFYSSEEISEVLKDSEKKTVTLIECLEKGEKMEGVYQSGKNDKELSVKAFSKQHLQ